MMYLPSEVPQNVNGVPVLAFAPVLTCLPNQDTAPSGRLARVIVPAPAGFAVLSLAWQDDSGTWFQDGTKLVTGYALALRYLTEHRVRAGEFSRSI
jgi:hypothetical protein